MARSKINKPLLLVLAGISAWAGLCFALGYRLPQPDRHPDWPQVPRLSNPHLVVELIPDFAERYGRRFPFVLARQGRQQWNFSDVYQINLRNVRSLGYCITDNDFEGLSFRVTSGGNDVGRSGGSPTRFGFRNEGVEYLQLQLGTEHGGFNYPFRGTPNGLVDFYQYNDPKRVEDTLYLRNLNADWRVVYR